MTKGKIEPKQKMIEKKNEYEALFVRMYTFNITLYVCGILPWR